MAIPMAQQRKVLQRSGNICAFPDCRLLLTAGGDSDDPVVVLGEIAHIVAESPHGPRGTSPLTLHQRNMHANLILLCPQHHRLIDSEGALAMYTVERLTAMKQAHEQWVERTLRGRSNVGTELPAMVQETAHSNRLEDAAEKHAGHAFISYVREDAPQVDLLQQALEAAGVSVWRDTTHLWPGEDWRMKIRRAITNNALVFIACFSSQSTSRTTSYQNEELTLAIDQLRKRRPDIPWLIPVRLDDCHVPDLEIGGGRTLKSIHRADLFGNHMNDEMNRMLGTVRRLLGQKPSDDDKPGPPSVEDAKDKPSSRSIIGLAIPGALAAFLRHDLGLAPTGDHPGRYLPLRTSFD